MIQNRSRSRPVFMVFLLFSILFFSFINFKTPISIAKSEQQSENGNIKFQVNQLYNRTFSVYYEDYSFVFSLKPLFIRVRPFVIYNNTFYGLKKIVQFLKSNYPNVNYEWLINKTVKAIQYGFNLTKIPQDIANKIDYVGFRLVDYNFPLKLFELEEIEVVEKGYNITLIHLPKANLVFSFQDLYPYGYSIKHINKTYILIGNVQNRTDLILDPMVYSANTITVTGYDEDSPFVTNDLWVQDKFGTVQLENRTNINGTDGSPVLVDYPLKPADYVELGGLSNDLWIYVSYWTNMYNSTIRVRGKDRVSSSIVEDVLILGNGYYYLLKKYAEITSTQVITFYKTDSGSFTYELRQGQWGVIWKTGKKQFYSDCKIVLGDGVNANRAFWNETDAQLIFNPSIITGSWQYLITVKHYSGLIWGKLQDETARRTSNGFQIIYTINYGSTALVYVQSMTTIEIYSSSFTQNGTVGQPYVLYCPNEYSGYHKRLWNCIFTGRNLIRMNQPNEGDVYNLIMQKGLSGFSTGTELAYMNRIYITDYTEIISIGGTSNLALGNVYGRGMLRLAYIGTNWSGHVNFTNVDTNIWKFLWSSGATGEVYRRYTLNLQVTFDGLALKNVNVTISNAHLNFSNSWLTFANGSIPEQIYSMGHYNLTGSNNIYNYNPYTLIVEMDGYQTYTQTFNVTEPLHFKIELQKSEFSTGFFIGGIILFAVVLVIAVAYSKR